MSKQGSQVAFIPDNISNISSGKQRFNEDTSQKMQQSYISKLTKIPNNNHDQQIQQLQIKGEKSQKFSTNNQFQVKQLVKQISDRINGISLQGLSMDSNLIGQLSSASKSFEKKPLMGKYTGGGQFSGNDRRYQHYDLDSTPYHGKHTQTDVISEKESFIEQQEDFAVNTNISDRKDTEKKKPANDIFATFRKPQSSQAIQINQIPQYQILSEPQFYITQINKYDQFDTQLGWLQHCNTGNTKNLYIQTNELLRLNKLSLNEIQKVQLRTKIIELQIQTNKLKMLLRKHVSTKHINFSVDFKFGRDTYIRMPKKIDLSLRQYADQLQKRLNEKINQHEENDKELKLLQFYYEQFEKKVNFAYIYQEYLIDKAKRQLQKTMNLSFSTRDKLKSSSKNKNLSKTQKSLSQTKTFQKVTLNNNKTQNDDAKKNDEYYSDNDQSITSLAHRLKIKKVDSNSPKKFIRTDVKSSDKVNISTPLQKSNSQNHFHHSHASPNNPKHTLNITTSTPSPTKNLHLTHHKDITLPTNQTLIQLPTSQQPFVPLFNTPNRAKKHFYYECQQYLQQLQEDYLFNCEQQKQTLLLKNQDGFRHRELLKMKTLQMKNQILDTQVDFKGKEKDLKKQNSILKQQLKLLQEQLYSKFGSQNSDNLLHDKKSVKSPHKIKNLLPDQYDLLYKQAQRRLKSFKSHTMLQSVKPMIPKSPKKSAQILKQSSSSNNFLSQRNIQKVNQFIKQKDNQNISQKSNATLKKEIKHDQKLSKSKSPHLKIKKSLSGSKKFLNRFKTNLSQGDPNQTIKQLINETQKDKKTTINPQRTTIANATMPEVHSVEDQYYAV